MNSLRFSGSLTGGTWLPAAHRPLDPHPAEASLHRDLVILEHALRRQRRRHHDLLVLDFADALGDQLGLDGLAVDLLHLARGLVLGQRGDALELGLRVLVAREDALEVEHRQATEPADDPGGLRRDHAVHRRGQHRQLELVGPQLPRDVDVVGVARAPRGHDRDVVEAVGPTRLLTASNLYFHVHILAVAADEKTPRSAGPKGGRRGAARGFSADSAKWIEHSNGHTPARALGYARSIWTMGSTGATSRTRSRPGGRPPGARARPSARPRWRRTRRTCT